MTNSGHHFQPATILPGTSAFTRYAGWLSVAERRVFTTLYRPLGATRNLGVVLCAPPFHEYVHSHRAYRHLAEKLATAGIAVARFDYSGLGCSSDDLFAPQLIDTWVSDIVAQAELLSTSAGITQLGLFGFRFGATLAAMAAEKLSPRALAVWNPIASGKSYARELQAIAKFSEVPPEPDQGFLECAGFAVTPETLEAIKRAKFTPIPAAVAGLVVHEGEQSDVAGLGGANPGVRFLVGEGAAGVLEEPHKTVVPHVVLDQIRDWFTERAEATSDTAWEGAALESSWVLPSGTTETLVTSERGIVGVMTYPARDTAPELAVIVANAGSVHLPGPNQVNVELTRFLGDHGVASLRIDLSNLGESCVGTPEQENVTYPDQGVEDVLSAVDGLAETLPGRKIVLSGVCSGAYHSFQAAIQARQDSKLAGALLINPLTYYWEKGSSILSRDDLKTVGQEQYYAQSMRDPKRWMKLLSGNVDVSQLAGFVRRAAVRQSKNAGKKLLERVGLVEKSRLAADAERVLSAKRYLRFIFSDTDPGYKLLLHQGGSAIAELLKANRLPLAFITRSDHTFAHWKSRREMFEVALDNLRRGAEAER